MPANRPHAARADECLGCERSSSRVAKGAGKGPVGVPTPPELGGLKKGIGGNKTAAIIAYLLSMLPFYIDPGRYVVYLDNLFTSLPLLKYLRNRG